MPGLDGGLADGEGGAAAGGQEVEAERVGVGDRRHDLFGDSTCTSSSAAISAIDARDPPISGLPDRDADRAVFVDVHGHAGIAADIEPESGGDAPALIGAELRFLVVRDGRASPRGISTRPTGPKVGP